MTIFMGGMWQPFPVMGSLWHCFYQYTKSATLFLPQIVVYIYTFHNIY